MISIFFFLIDTATPEIYPLPLHTALPISEPGRPTRSWSGHSRRSAWLAGPRCSACSTDSAVPGFPDAAIGERHPDRSEEHTSELQSQSNLVCRLLLEKKKQNTSTSI